MHSVAKSNSDRFAFIINAYIKQVHENHLNGVTCYLVSNRTSRRQLQIVKVICNSHLKNNNNDSRKRVRVNVFLVDQQRWLKLYNPGFLMFYVHVLVKCYLIV